MEYLTKNIDHVRSRVQAACLRSGRNPDDVSIVGVSKTQPIDTIVKARNLGIRTFGENYVQELLLKHAHDGLDDVSWHFIGHLQSNKVKYIAPFVRMIHSVDSASLAHEISRQAVKFHRRIDILFQVNTSGESSKSGVALKDLLPLVRDCISLPSIRLCGLMTIPAPVDDADDVRSEFRLLRELCDSVRTELSLPSFVELSMGMSDDYEVAIEEGATIIRPGTALFGSRQAIS
jgi:pyridoxal phosphate enzyme (YggS family)